MTRSLLIIAALLCALAAPSAALAQGAGDEQYQDPFGEEQSQSEPTPTPTPAPAQPAPAQPAPAQPPAAPAQAPAPAQASQTEQLPRTGADAGWLALAGAVLLAAGIALRRADLQR
jgi:2-oxoglutarate dehydrogenase E2 component (dihydrolipoamide succinyltransferase)